MPGEARTKVHREYIGLCSKCQSLRLGRDIETTLYNVSIEPCGMPESDASLRERTTKGGMIGVVNAQYRRMPCAGQVVRVDHHDAAVAAYLLGGVAAVAQLLQLPSGWRWAGGQL